MPLRLAKGLWLLALMGALPVAQAQSTMDVSELAALRAADRHSSAADLGLRAVLEQPWDHSLRYLVADSLEKAGRTDEARAQFSALQGTPLHGAAQGRLAALAGRSQATPAALPPAAAIATVAPSPTPVAAAPANTPPRRLGSTATAPTASPAPTPVASTPANAQPRRLGRPATTPAAAPAPTPVASRPATPPPSQPSSPEKKIEALYASGDFAAAGREGLRLLSKGNPDAELQLKIANSLAWSGRLKAGQDQYRALADSSVGREAQLGLANTHRWNGRPDLAIRLFQQVLNRHPGDAEATEGLRQARQDLAPTTVWVAEQSRDINPIERSGGSVAHRWFNEAGDTRMELRLSGSDDASTTPPVDVSRRALSASIERRSHLLQPQITLTLQQQPDQGNLFGSARIKLGELPVWLKAGRLDWGQEALSPRAGVAGLVARQGSLEFQSEFDWGQFQAQVDHYGISDGNTVSAAQARWTPYWRPLGARWRPFLSLDVRDAQRPTLEYWSPSRGHGSLAAGLSTDWSRDRWSLYGSAQYGVPLLPESGNSWSASLGGRYQMTDDLALSFGLWGMSSRRDDAAYRARQATLQLDKAWR